MYFGVNLNIIYIIVHFLQYIYTHDLYYDYLHLKHDSNGVL